MSTSTSTSIVIKDGKKVTTKTVTTTDSDGKKKVETFVEEEKDVAKGGHDMFKNRIREVKEIGPSSDNEEKREGQKTKVPSPPSSPNDSQCEEENVEFTEFQLETLSSHNKLRLILIFWNIFLCQGKTWRASDGAQCRDVHLRATVGRSAPC